MALWRAEPYSPEGFGVDDVKAVVLENALDGFDVGEAAGGAGPFAAGEVDFWCGQRGGDGNGLGEGAGGLGEDGVGAAMAAQVGGDEGGFDGAGFRGDVVMQDVFGGDAEEGEPGGGVGGHGGGEEVF